MVALLGSARHHHDTVLLPPDHISGAGLYGLDLTLRGRVEREPGRGRDRIRLRLQLREVIVAETVRAVSGRVLATLPDFQFGLQSGDSIVLRGRLTRPPGARNPGGFDYRQQLRLQHVYGLIRIGSPGQVLEIERGEPAPVDRWFAQPLRGAVRGAVDGSLSGAAAGLMGGLLLGEKHRIPEAVRDNFRRVGLAHALVISGLHVGLVALFAFTALKLCRAPDRLAAVVTGTVLMGYAVVTQMAPPVVRAAIMANVVLCGRALCRRGDPFNSLGLAALLILALWPTCLRALGFQLSFLATAAILGLHGPLAARFPVRWRRENSAVGRWVVLPLCVSVAAQLGTAPLIAYHFQQLAPIGLVANLIAVPLLALAVALGLMAALTGWWLPAAATAFNGCNYLVISALLAGVETLATWPGAAVAVARPGVRCAATAVGAACVLMLLPRCRRSWRGALFLCVIWLNVAVWVRLLEPQDLRVVFLDVGQGDAAVIRFPNGTAMVVDGGSRSSYYDHGARTLLPVLGHLGISTIDVVVASHPHNDHIGGLVTLLERVPVRHYVDSGQLFDSWTARRLRQLIAEKEIAYHPVAAGDSLAGLGGVGGLVLHPTRAFVAAAGSPPHNTNNGSVVLRLTYGDCQLLFTGDAEEETDAALAGWGRRLRADVLKVAHHGSATSSRPWFLDAVAPAVAVISVGAVNRFGHPAPQVLAALEHRQVQGLRTDEEGAAMLCTDGRTLQIQTMARQPWALPLRSDPLLEEP